MTLSSNPGSTWTNQGMVSMTSSTVNLGGMFTIGTLGAFSRSGGTVNLTGTLDNTGPQQLTLSATTGSWRMFGGTIAGGTVTGDAAGFLEVAPGQFGTLDNVILESPLVLLEGAIVRVKNGLVLNNVIRQTPLSTNNSAVVFQDTQTLSGTGEIAMATTGGQVVVQSGTTTFGPGITIHGFGSVASSGGTFVNQGEIRADVSGRTLVLGSVTNQGVIAASQGGGVVVTTPLSNSGTLAVGATSTFQVTASFEQMSAGTLELHLGEVSIAEYGSLDVTGAATLSGILRVVLDGVFVPGIGSQFQVLNANPVQGTFTTHDLPPGLNWNVAYALGSVTVQRVP